MAVLTRSQLQVAEKAMVDALPNEGCGLLIGDPNTGVVARFVAVTNAAASPVSYRLDDAEYLAAVVEADRDELDIVGVVHSHPTTEARPSPTDLARAAESLTPPEWLWLIVSLADGSPRTRAWRIADGAATELVLGELI